MHTQCPSCLTIFRVGASQLAEGRGQVRCGHCRRSFPALDTLSDVLPEAHQPSLRLHASPSKPVELTQVSRGAPAPHAALFAPLPPEPRAPLPPPEPMVALSPTPTIEPGYGDLTEVFTDELDARVGRGSDAPAVDETRGGHEGAPTVRFDGNGWPVADEPGAANAQSRPRQVEMPPGVAPNRDSHRPLDRITARHAHRAAIEPAAPAFARRRARGGRTGSGWGWWFGSVLLMLILTGQVAWAARSQLMDVPTLRPLLLRACEQLHCPLPKNPIPDSITLAARDVRPHPSVRDALIIGATLVNEAEFSQPFPVIEITLADVNERRIGMRRFQPNEYVSDRRTLQRGIPPTGTALFSVEVEDPGKRAVAFEFRFL